MAEDPIAPNEDDLCVFTRKQVHEMIQECASNQSHGGFMAARALGDARCIYVGTGFHNDFITRFPFNGHVESWRDLHAEVDL